MTPDLTPPDDEPMRLGIEQPVHHFRIIQDGMNVAGGSSCDKARLDREMDHYASVYAQDGTIRIEVRFGKGRWRELLP